MDKLKPCPFCGGEAKHNSGGTSTYGRLWWAIWCDKCQFEVRDREVWDSKMSGYLDASYPPKECFSTWNTRADPWQPIETAPKDVELLLGWRGFGQEWETCTDFAYCSRGGWYHGSATHWMHIHNPPA